MKFAVVANGIPNPTASGSALTPWSLIQYLIEAGHAVTAFPIENLYLSPTKVKREDQLAALSALGAKISLIDGSCLNYTPNRPANGIGRLFLPRLEDYYPTALLAPTLRSALEIESPQAIFAYHFEALAATYQLGIAPLVSVVVDPSHLPAYFRWRVLEPLRLNNDYLQLTAAMAAGTIWLPRYMRRMMLHCAVSGAFAAHHAAWYRRIGVSNCQYFCTPVADDGGSRWQEQRQQYKSKTKYKILLIGHLYGTATLSGLYLFCRTVLPILEQHLGPDKLEVHVVGGHRPPPDLRRLLDHPMIKMRGQIEPPNEEFFSSDVLVVPTPINLGMRVRIAVGFSFGSCVVAHHANALGIPEMIHEKNALLAKDGASMARMILRALGDQSLRERLGREARRTYETYFAPSVAGKRLALEMERAATGRRLM